MYRSCLLINVGTNPDRPRPARWWLRNRYRVHQRLCMGFPSRERTETDAQFLKPWDPRDFPEQRHLADKPGGEVAPDVLRQVHAQRDERSGFLFRIDPRPGRSPVILVQSAGKPDWDYAFHNARHMLRCFDVRSFSPAYAGADMLRFRLLANPTKRLRADSIGPDGGPIEKQWVGKRVPVATEMLEEWLSRRGERGGFRVQGLTTVEPAWAYMNKTRDRGKGQRLRSVRYEGVLEVADSARFEEAVVEGIGPAKAFGFGLLSVAPLR